MVAIVYGGVSCFAASPGTKLGQQAGLPRKCLLRYHGKGVIIIMLLLITLYRDMGEGIVAGICSYVAVQ